jgi:hypothetical protein
MPFPHRRTAILSLLIAVAAGGSVAAQKLKPEEEAAIRPAGPAKSCIPIAQIRETRVRDDRTIDFVMNGRTVYRNTLPSPCPELGVERRFGYETSLSQLCSTDIVTVLRTGPVYRGASCGLGQFQPVTGVPR